MKCPKRKPHFSIGSASGTDRPLVPIMKRSLPIKALIYLVGILNATAFRPMMASCRTTRPVAAPPIVALMEESSSTTNEYRNVPTKVFSNFMTKKELQENIDFSCPKIPKVSLDILARALDASLYETEWFVTGQVDPRYFSDQFQFQDPDVKVSGIKEYALGVYTVFNQDTARAQIISTVVSPEKDQTITCTWRLSGRVDIGPGLEIKPYIVFTDFTVDPVSGLIILQEDRFDLPQWDILLSAIFPFFIGKLTALPAPEPGPRIPPPQMPKELISTP
jgi:hypothetical protein